MMKHLLLPSLLMTAPFVVSGCSESLGSASRMIEITPSITRVADLCFETGDRIGLTVLKGSDVYVQNHPMTYDGSLFADPELVWYDDPQQKATLTAYYPYAAEGLPAEFTVATDQRTGCEASDLLGAALHDVRPADTPVGMLFHHLLTQLTVVIDNTSGSEVTDVTVDGFIPTAVVDLTVPAAEVKAGAASAEIRACVVSPGLSYRAILVPQQGELAVTVVLSDGTSRRKTLSGVSLAGGKRYDLSVTVAPEEVEVSLSGEIEDWADGGSLDSFENPVSADDPDPSELVYEGVIYPTLRIGDRVWMAANLRCQPETLVENVDFWYPQSGFDTDPELGLLYSYTAASGAAEAGSPVQGICPDGWRLPTTDELLAMAGSAERPADFLKCAGFLIVSSTGQRFGSSNAGYLMGSELSPEGKCRCLSYTTTSEPVEAAISVDYGISVRCVQD